MKILHVNNERTWRGGERQTFLLATGLRDCGVASAIGCRPGSPLQQRAEAEAVPTRSIPGNNAGAAMALIRAARDYDLIHCHTGRSHSLAAATAAWHHKPFVVTRRVDFLPNHGWFNQYKFRRAARVVCISRFIADQLAQWGVPLERLTVISSTVPGPDPKFLTPQHRDAARERLGIPPGVKLVGNIAALVQHKDQATFLRAAKSVVTRRNDVRFVILGEGERKQSLLALRRELQLEDYVFMPGFVPQAEQYLPAFDVFAMSSSMEGLGSIVLDAFAAGVPVAATAGGGLPELVRDGETGLLVPVGDADALAEAISCLLDDTELAGRVSSTARAWIQKECSVARMADSYLEVYRHTLAG